MEASSTIDRIVPYVEYYTSDITVAHPMKLKVISQSMKKTDRNDAHILLELDRLGYVPESYLPPVDSGDQGNCTGIMHFLSSRESCQEPHQGSVLQAGH